MTAEIAVLNKFGVALAADSAITVDTFHEGEIKTKVYNTANKLFSLSKYHPVGIMFYNTVTLGGIPWETVIKCYRKKLGRQSFGTVDEYARDIFSWLNSSPAIFDEEMGANIIQRNLYREFYNCVHAIKAKDKFVERFDRHIAELEKADYIDGFDEVFGRSISMKYKDQIDNACKYMVKKSSYIAGSKNKLIRLAELIFTKRKRLSGYS